MDLRLTVADARGDGRCTDLLVTAPDDATWADLVEQLPDRLRSRTGWYAAGSPVHSGTPLGSVPLLDGVVLTPEGPDPDRSADPIVGTVLELHVAEGPDSGGIIRLPFGRTRIGRSVDAGLRLGDPTLSRLHAELHVGHDGIQLVDLGTTNGTFVSGSRAEPHERTRVTPGQRIRLGATTLVLRVPRVAPAATLPDGQGHLGVNRGPREQVGVPDVVLTRPTPPEAPDSTRMSVLTLVLPLLLSLVLAYVLDSAVMLLFGLMGPVMMMSSHLGDRRNGRLGHRRGLARHREQLQQFEGELQEALVQEARARHRRAPDAAELLATAREPGARLWHRRPGDDDFLRLRLGTATLPATVTVQDGDGREEHPPLDDVPLEVALPDVGVLGVAAPPEASAGCVRGLLGQVVGWHSPRDVRLVLLVAESARLADWTWLAWLPHAREPEGPPAGRGPGTRLGLLEEPGQVAARLAELGALLDERLAAAVALGRDGPAWPVVVLVLDGARALRGEAGVARLLADGPSVGIFTLCTDTDVARLPAETGATLVIEPSGAGGRLRTGAGEPLTCTPGLVPEGWADRLAHHLSPLRDATPTESSAGPPDSARLLEVNPFDATDAAAVASHWRASPRSTAFVVGVGAEGTEVLDLCRDGPHALVGGTTGSGKSELLQTMIASLALGNRPDEMVFVLVDYKGGSAFKECARLPHTVGLVTDLDAHLTARALTSLEAELKRRERILGGCGAKDLEDYQRVAGPEALSVPRLVLVIDEFKMLAEDLPDFVDGLVRIAAVGRSLGVHLVLATQRPGGIVSSDIKANVNLRIALRVRDRADSDDVLEDPAAATISGRTPGRAYLRSGSNGLRLFQTARVGGHGARRERQSVIVQPLSLTAATTAPSEDADAADGEPTDLCRLVDATRAAVGEAGISPVASPWLPPLPDAVALPAPGRAGPWVVPYAVADLPDAQSQSALEWDLEHDGHLAFAGSARSGRTTALRTIAGAIARRCSPRQVHLHAFDGSGGLRVLADLPHAGAVVARDEPARGARLLQRLLAEVADRQAIWAQLGYSSLADQHHEATATGTEPLPYLVVLLDDWDTFTETYDQVDHGRPVQEVQQLLREGPSVGVRVALTGGRSVLLSQLASLVAGRFCLRMADDNDLLLAGLPAASRPAAMPPGRALRVDDGVEVHLAVLASAEREPVPGAAVEPHGSVGSDEEGGTPDASGRTQVRLLRELARRATADEAGAPAPPRRLRPLRVEPLPRVVPLADVAAAAAGATTAATAAGAATAAAAPLLLGVGGDDLDPLALDPTCLSFLVAGPAGSGRTSALELLAHQLVGLGRAVVVVADERSALATAGSLAGSAWVVDPAQPQRIRELQRDHPDLVAVVDDVERLVGTEADDVLVDLLRAGRRSGAGVVCAGMTHELLSQFRGLAVAVRRQQTGLLLQPSSPGDGELFTVRVSPLRERLPGRGLHVDRGRVTPVQVALPPQSP